MAFRGFLTETIDTDSYNKSYYGTSMCLAKLSEDRANRNMVSAAKTMLLEFAAQNDVEGFNRSLCDESEVKEVGLWYGRDGASRKMVFDHRTPLMVAAQYGSIDIVKLIVCLPDTDVNFSCGLDKSTALHCAASGGSVNAIDVVKLLLRSGADPNSVDNNGCRPIDVVLAPPNLQFLRISLEELLSSDGSVRLEDSEVSGNSFPSSSSSLSLSTDEGPTSTVSGSIFSPVKARKEFPADPSLPDINNSVYGTDEFRMYSFKVRLCARAYAHVWTECAFAHPGEKARRRDPMKFRYGCAPCPDHRKGTCKRGDLCEFSHGIFECWLHPSQYRTRLCKEGMACTRRVCFFAHSPSELRTLNSSPSAVSAFPASPSLRLRGNNVQASRLRTTANAKDIPSEELNGLQEFGFQGQQVRNEWNNISTTQVAAHSETLNPLLFAMMSSPRYIDQLHATLVSSPSYKAAVLNQFLLKQRMLPHINTNGDNPHLNASFGSTPTGRMSPRPNQYVSPESLQSILAQREMMQQQFCSQSSQELGLGSQCANLWSNVNANGVVQEDGFGRLRTASSDGDYGEEPDVSWVNTMLTDLPCDTQETIANPLIGSKDHLALQVGLEGLQMDQIPSR